MNDDLVRELRTQMHDATAGDRLPHDLVGRVRSGVRRRRQRQLALAGSSLAVAGVAAAALLAGSSQGRTTRLDVAAPPSPGAGSAAVAFPGPSDGELRGAQWFSYRYTSSQIAGEEQRWEGRDGRHIAKDSGGEVEQYAAAGESGFEYGVDGITWEELLALDPSTDALRRELELAQGGRPLPERMTNQIRQLLARSPALAPVREGLVRVLGEVEGVTVTGGERDSLGRPATRYDQPSIDGTVLSLFVDAGSARLLEEVTVVGPDGFAEPTEAPVAVVAPVLPEATTEPQPAPGAQVYRETWLSWTTSPPPAS